MGEWDYIKVLEMQSLHHIDLVFSLFQLIGDLPPEVNAQLLGESHSYKCANDSTI